MHFIKHIINTLQAKISPVAYARRIGVVVGTGVRIFSLHPGSFGSEPYLVTLEDGVIVTANVKFITHDGSTFIFRRLYPDLDVMGPIRVGANTFIGSGAVILPGVRIGKNCVIGAMSLVTRNVPDDSLAVGAPARVIESTDSFLRTLLARNSGTGAMSEIDKRRALESMTPTPDFEGREWLMR